MRTFLRASLLTLVASTLLLAVWQNAGDAPAFEVASVKPSVAAIRKGSMRGGPGTDSPGQITVTALSLQRLVLSAYQLRDDQYRGPAWMNTELYDIVAKVPAGTTADQARAMMRQLLETRFHMVTHREALDRTVLDLVVARGGPKMKDSPRSDSDKFMGMPGNLTAGGDGFPEFPADYVRTLGAVTVTLHGEAKTVGSRESMGQFAEHLTRQLHQPVFDKTGLTGLYEFTFKWIPDGAEDQPSATGAVPPAGAVGRSIFEAVEKELGLKLEKRKAAIDTLVIDRAEKVPVEN